jgi:hypothetical protein
MIVITTIVFLYIQGVIKLPEQEMKEVDQTSIDKIMYELRSLPDIEIKKLKIDLKQIFEKVY